MFETDEQQLDRHRGLKIRVRRGGKSLTFAGAIDLWRSDKLFRSFFISRLAAAPFNALRWETPPITAASVGGRFEFVLLESPELNIPPDMTAFRTLFDAEPERDVISFLNLGHDAELVVPLPRGPLEAYSHLAAFTRRAPEAQNHALWQAVGNCIHHTLGDRPVWVSTAGGGVPWLHVRLDTWPKYYGYDPYRRPP